MLRCGYREEAADYCWRESQGKINNDLLVVAEHLKNNNQHAKISSLYKACSRTDNDPYKCLVLNILGGFDYSMSSKFSSTLLTPQDQMWFYLTMFHAKVIDKNILVEKTNSITTTSPILKFQIYLLTDNYYKGYCFLRSYPEYYLDAVHFAICFAQYNLGSSSVIIKLYIHYITISLYLTTKHTHTHT